MFRKICKMSQKELKKFVASELDKTHNNIVVGDGYVYAQGDIPVLLVAHLDTVHAALPNIIVYDKKSNSLSSPQGIGGDDRCGVYMILEIIKRYNCSVLFCEDEESGGVGATKFTQTKLAQKLDFNYMIELDRQGCDDAVFYHCDNEEFADFITKDYFQVAWGTFSDISILAPFFGCAAVNLSCGYYKPHTKDEYVVLHEMEENIGAVCSILERTTENDKFEYIEDKGGYYDWYDDERLYYIEWQDKATKQYYYVEINATSKAAAVGQFCMEHPDMTYSDLEVWVY